MYTIGQKVALTRRLQANDGGAAAAYDIDLPAGAAGTVIDTGDKLNPSITVKFRTKFACLADWNNSADFDLEADGGFGVALASEYLA